MEEQIREWLRQCWARELDLEEIGDDDNFFALGGDSIEAVEILLEMQHAFGVTLEVNEFTDRPTISLLAAHIQRQRKLGVRSNGSQLCDLSGRRFATLGQQQLWLAEQASDAAGAYGLTLSVEAIGPLDERILRRSLTTVLQRHEPLRSAFYDFNGDLRREPVALNEWPLEIIPAEGLTGANRTEFSELRAAELESQRFDLSRGSLIRARWLRFGPTDHQLLFGLHHIAGDGWSVGLLLEELAQTYEAHAFGRRASLPNLRANYDDFAHYQREFLRSDAAAEQLRWWSERLDGAPEVLLPRRFAPLDGEPRHGSLSRILPKEVISAVQRFSRERHITAFATLLAAFQAVLARHVNSEDVMVATPVACRFERSWMPLIGYFVNLLAIRAQLDDDPPFGELAARVHRGNIEALARWQTPLDQVVSQVAPERDARRNPLARVAFAHHEELPQELVAHAVTLHSPRVRMSVNRFDLEFHLWSEGNAIRLEAQYDRRVADDAAVERLADDYCQVLHAALGNPKLRVSSLPCSVLAEAPATDVQPPAGGDFGCLRELFAAQAARTPRRPAIVCDRGSISYGELHERANRLAVALAAYNLAPEAPVAVCIEPLEDFVEAVLAILAIGGCYLPLDAEWPDERLATILRDSRSPLLVTEQRLCPRLACLGVPTVSFQVLRGLAKAPKPAGGLAPRARVASRRAACVMYTSGSTGAPKGVVVEQRSIASLVMETDYVRLGAEDVVAQAANRAFDASTFEIWGALLHGATLAEFSKEDLLSPDALQDRLRRHGVTTLFLTTAAFHQVARQNPRAFAGLRTLLFGGERGDPRSVADAAAQGVVERLVHVYGPTETTTFATWFPVEPPQDGHAAVPIGRPIRRVRAYVLDCWLHPASIGVVGELYVAGFGLARGYVAAPGATAERFLPDPWAPTSGERMYRTGDLAVRRPDGTIEFVGRVDHQIKLRGRRIEPGEIEATLRRHPQVCEAVVSLDTTQADPSLIAWIEAGPAEEDGPVSLPTGSQLESELRDFLQVRFPAWMVPSRWRIEPALPRTLTGKVDRAALRSRSSDKRCGDEAEYAPPRSPEEAAIARVFQRLLGTDRVGAHDNFFHLGGHSLQATQVVSRLRTALLVDLPLAAVFRSPSPALLANEVQRARNDLANEDAATFRRLPRHDGVFPLSYAQQRLWFLDQLEPNSIAYNIPFGMRLVGRLDAPALRRALDALVERHEALRTTFGRRESEPVQIIAARCECPWELLDLSRLEPGAQEGEAQRLAVQFAERSFDLSRDCMLRARLLRLRDDEHVLVLVLHHIACDGWSLGVLAHELPTLYNAMTEGSPSPLSEPPVQYADFAVWQRGWLEGARCEKLLAWWRRQVDGVRVLQLPTDRPRTPQPTSTGRVESRRIDADLTRATQALCREENVTLFMCLLTVFQTLLARYTGERDIAVGSPIANRRFGAIEGLIGFFVNSLVMRTNLSGDPTFRKLLRRVRQMALDVYERQDLPFEKLVEEVRPERELSHNPLFQVTFAVQNAPLEAPPMRDVELRPFVFDVTAVRFDLELDIRERDQGLVLYAFYRTDLFDRSTVQNFLAHFENLLGEFVRNPDLRLSQAAMLSAAERRRLVVDPNRTQAPPLRAFTLHGLFESQAQRTPDRVAACQGERRLTYQELDEQANQVAARLRGLGVTPEEPVAIQATRSLETLAAMLGVLKAGGVCLPLDPQHPQQRVAGMVTQARFVLCDEEFPAPAKGISLLRICELLQRPDGGPARKDHDLPPIQGDRAAYILFTSGSTGVPNGVVLTHRALVNYAAHFAERIGLRAADRVLQFASPGFDVILEELFPTWSVGGAVVLADAETMATPDDLQRLLEKERITGLELPAAFWRPWVDGMAAQGHSLPGALRWVLVGCEQPDVPRLRWWQERGVGLFTVFGLTETSVTSSVCALPVGPGAAPVETPLSLGPPLANTQYYVLDECLNPVPAGVVGELFIGGEGLARGYLNQPGRTAQRFVPDPFGAHGARLYRTGDLARLRRDGSVEFLGRRDDQLNLRGFRIEAGEVEAALRRVPLVTDAAVVLREQGSSGPNMAPRHNAYLAGYVVGNRRHEQFIESVRRVHQRRLHGWRTFYDETYRQASTAPTPDFNLAGWVSTYTGEPIASEGMHEQVAQAVARVLARRPQSVLEIGCGAGLLLFPIATHCQRYVATDISAGALESVRTSWEALALPVERLQLLHRAAHQVDDLPPQSFDVVCLNSVIQHFPDAEHLLEVLTHVAATVRDGGAIFLGDVRFRGLLSAFYASVELFQARGDEPPDALRQRIARRRANELDLVIDPDLFNLLAARVPRLREVRIEPKRGRHANELCRYRFDVTLILGEPQPLLPVEPWRDWQPDWTCNRIEERLSDRRPETLALRGIPNRRVLGDVQAARMLEEQRLATVAEVRRRINAEDAVEGLDPEDLWRVADKHSYTAQVRLSRIAPEQIDVVFVRRDLADAPPGMLPMDLPEPMSRLREPAGLANNPSQVDLSREVGKLLCDELKKTLPLYMVPSIFVLLDHLPVTTHGKVDRSALPPPPAFDGGQGPASVLPPETDAERRLAVIWRDALRLEQVGANQSFFELGGHSLVAAQVISRVRSEFGVETPLRAIFECPVLRDFAARIDAQRAGGEQRGSVIITPADRREPLPLSYSQERLWFLDRLDPGHCGYLVHAAWRLDGPLDASAFRRAAADVAQRHETLRTVFPEDQGRPVQQIESRPNWAVEITDLSALAHEAQERALFALSADQQGNPMDLATGPLVRCRLVRGAPERHVLLLTMHHIVCDGWSLSVFYRELAACYEARQQGREPALPPLPIAYGDYARWQRERLQGERVEATVAHWRRRLASVERLELPCDGRRPPVTSHRGAARGRRLPWSLWRQLEQLAEREDATLFMTLFAAFHVLLSRLTGQTNLAVGVPFANRNLQETAGLIGFFVNTLPLRVDLSGDPTFAQLLAQVRATVVDALAHAEAPFDRLVQELQPERSLSHHPVFQTVFAVETEVEPQPALIDVTALPWEAPTTVCRFDLEVHVLRQAAGPVAVAVYNRDLFADATMERWLEAFETLLTQIVANPCARLSQLEAVSETQRRELLLERSGSNAVADEEPFQPLHHVFAEHAKRRPEAVAVTDEEGDLTYSQLDQRSTAVAQRLLALGVSPEDRVGVCLERSAGAVVAILGVLKAGAAYVPLDPRSPDLRLRALVASVQPRVVITGRDGPSRLSHLVADTPLLVLEGAITRPSDARALPAVSPDQLAYIIFTSGTTGAPKGVAVSHRSLTMLLRGAVSLCSPGENDVWTMSHALVFDFSVWELWGALAWGGRLVVVPEMVRHAPEEFCHWLERHRVTMLNLTPTEFSRLLHQEPPETWRARFCLRTLFLGGEALDRDHVRRWIHALGDAEPQLVNLYGVTEATVIATAQRLTRSLVDEEWTGSPLGTPMAGWEAYLLDDRLRLVPPGAVGELCLGGRGVARGYWNDPALTANSFVPHPTVAGARLYRTGDQARWRNDGTLEFHGRRDSQVKLRGHRIELGEIAAQLRTHPHVADAYVVLAATDLGERSLVAYFVSKRNEAGEVGASAAELNHWLRDRLPFWMIPQGIVELSELPRSASGKIDERALPRAAVGRAAAASYVPPRNLAEQTLADLWADVLGAESVGVHDNFFELGGHSLLATQLVSRIRETFAVDLPLRAIFETPHIAGLSRWLDIETGNRFRQNPIERIARGKDLPLSFAQQRLWFLNRLDPGGCAYNVPIALRIVGPLDSDHLQQSLDLLTARHEALRTVFVESEDGPAQRILPAASCPTGKIDLRHLGQEQRQERLEHYARLEESFPFDLAAGPLLRAVLFRLGADEHVLLLTLHHIACDGWSIGVLTRELAECYEALRQGQTPQLPELAVQYADFAAWQRRTLHEEALRDLLAWWTTTLAGLTTTELPRVADEKAGPAERGSTTGRVLSGELLQGVKSLSRAHAATPYMTLLTALDIALARLTGSRDLAVGAPVANRQRRELEPVVGFFINTLVIRVRWDDDPTFAELLERVRQTTVEALAHQDLPFERLVAELQPDRMEDHNPLFRILFGVQNTPRVDLPTTTFQPLGLPIGTARFDLEILAWEHPETLELVAAFRPDRVRRTVVERLFDAVVDTLAAATSDATVRVSRLMRPAGNDVLRELPPPEPDERRPTMVPAVNRSAIRHPRPTRLEEFVAVNAARQPDRVAVRCGEAELTYGELNRQAAFLAERLRTAGIGPETPVGLFIERSPEMIVGMLAILQTGGAYVPLPPETPPGRVAVMLQHAGVRHVVLPQSLFDRLPMMNVERIALDGGSPASLLTDALARSGGLPAECALAYIMFTSGSTGTPKAVGVRHRSVVQLVVGADYVQFTAEDVVAQVASFAFDGSTFEIWGALLHGATLEIIGRDDVVSPGELRHRLVERRVSMAFLPTSLFHELAAAAPEMFRSLRYVIVGGERIDPGVARQVLAEGPERLVNGYGPTETTTFATWQLIERLSPDAKSIPIGRPILGTECYVLDDDFQPVGPGERGELHIAGAGLSRGYLNDRRLTAERFLPNPFAQQPGERMYRTGDHVRLLPSGALEFLGRLDDQVKLRGYRIELGEVESLVQSHPEVDRAAVVVREDGDGERRLVCYVTRRGSERAALPPKAGAAGVVEHLENWRQLYEDLYRQDASQGADLNLIGWNSSYTGEPIPVAAMREQIDQTVQRIRRLGARRILEIGCGTGLLLFRLAADCDGYAGTDFSPVAIDYVRERLPAAHIDPARVELLVRDADNLDGFAPQSFDAVILNSVVQYFPTVEYLLRVLEKASQVVRPGGHIFVGDVRNLRLLKEFRTAVALVQARPGDSCEELQERVRFEVNQESELLLDPRFFGALRRRITRLADVRIELKQGVDQNELTQFRYDVTLSLAAEPDEDKTLPRVERWLRWPEDIASLEQLAGVVREQDAGAIGLRGVPNRRLTYAVAAASSLAVAPPHDTASQLRETIDERLRNTAGVDPVEIWRMAEVLNLVVEVRPSDDHPAAFDVACFSGEVGDAATLCTRSAFTHEEPPDNRPWDRLASNPLRPVTAREFGDRLAQHLRAMAPEHMVPARFVLLDRFPLNANGKIERRALPPPPNLRPGPATSFVDPRTRTERTLAAIWADLLRLDRVGATDNFFELGGHSLLATQVMTRVRSALRVEAPLRAMFESPTVAGLAARVDDLLATAASAPPLTLSPAEHREGAPLSFAQQRLWFLDQLEPGNCAYNMAAAIRLQGPLDTGALHGSLRAIVARHEALRTSFPMQDGRPTQRIAEAAECPLPVLDLSRLGSELRQREILRLASLEETTPFDLAEGPLFRFRLLRCAADDWVLLLTMHHIVSDGWSITVLVRELAAHYTALTEARSAELPKLPIQYADFALWQRDWLAGERLQMQLEYWRRQLEGLEPLRLPTDYARPSAQTYRGGLITRRLAAALRKAIETLAQREGATLFMTLLAALDVLLSRCSGQSDIAVGTPIANRNRREIEGLIGFFVNSLVIRTDLSDDPAFSELLARVREASLEAFAHQDLPFEKLVEELRPDRNLTRNPLFQVMFAVQNATRVEFALPQLTLQAIEFETTTTRFDLEIHVWDDEEGLTLRAFYNTDLFARATVERWLAHLETLLMAAVADPQRRVSELPLLEGSEQREILYEWNQLPEPAAPLLCLHSWFENVAAEHPRAVAVADGNRQLTYEELDHRANGIAARLQAKGIGPDVLVGLSTERSVAMMVGMLGILKAGSAYVPLDPAWPEERLRGLLQQTQAALVLTDSANHERWERLAAAPVALIDLEAPIAAGLEKIGASPVTPDQLAYVMFTSGSTGTPKGVQITHRNVVRLMQQAELLFDFRADDVWPLFHSFTFDFSVWEIWGALLHGARLEIPSYLVTRTPDEFIDWMIQRRVSVLNQTPTAFSQLLAVERLWNDPQRLDALRYVIFGGESLDPQILDRWFGALGDKRPRMINMYGITETTVHVTFLELTRYHARQRSTGSPIGGRLGDLQLYLLDEKLHPVPQGVIGEIYVGGAGLARGYWNDPAQTAERFLPHPWGAPGARLYRTGDLARYIAPGVLEHWGRCDEQMKIRGFRIEPREIEQCLRSHLAVRDALAMVRHIRPDDPWLVAYVTRSTATRQYEADLAGELHRHLRRFLPEHMLPRAYVMLEVLPRSANGKVKRDELPLPAAMRPELAGQFTAPRTATEREVAAIWADVLRLDRVGVHDSFFELGGHSLLATQVISRIRDALGAALPLRALFEAPNIAELAARIDETLPKAPQSPAVRQGQERALRRRQALGAFQQRRGNTR